MIETQHLGRAFVTGRGRDKQSVQAIEDIDLRAEDGRITGLLGPNGAGKSTTLRVLATLVRPDRGRAWVDGRDVVAEPLAARRRLGFLPHDAGLYPRLSARENLHYYAELCGLDRRESARRAEQLIEQLGMAEFADRRARGFSQGQRTKVALGRALIHRPGTLILDEPSNGLDVMATRKLRAVLRTLRDQGHCILVSSHVMQEVAVLCDEVAIINEGRIAMAGSVEGLLARTGQTSLEDAFVAAIGEDPEAGR